MKCNNKYCMWNHKDDCCPESEGDFINATPNMLDCPSALRVDFHEQHELMYDEVVKNLYKMSFGETYKIRKCVNESIEKSNDGTEIFKKYSEKDWLRI